ncbi:MAG: Gfo/Idh/MocA family oxidoreductase [Ignavibacteria bacterium]|nr:Gfo/Idh/MocA family oxidoreductase [Ignavibacteria bacterium]
MDNNNIKLAVIGAGKWGLNHIRTAYKLLEKNLITVCDINPLREQEVKKISSEISFTTDINTILESKEINSVIITTSAETHYDLAKKFILGSKNILVEKPMTLHSFETEDLIKLANDYDVKLMVGHVLLYHPAVKKIKELITEGLIGRIQYIYSNRLNLGSVRSEENILWSFAPHDVSVIQYLLESYPKKIYAMGSCFLQQNIEDVTLTYLRYPGNINAHIFVSWLHPFKEQRMVITGTKGMLVFEDSLKAEKLKFYPKGFVNINGVIQKFDDNYQVINYPDKQPLEEEQIHFYNCILNNTKPITDGYHALEVLKILEEASKKLKE